jgi:hypothetical protein
MPRVYDHGRSKQRAHLGCHSRNLSIPALGLLKCQWTGALGELDGEGEELMNKALMGASAAAVIALAPLCMPPAQAHADDPCVSIADPAVHQACIDEFLRDHTMDRYQMGDCQASPDYGQEGQVCRNFWVRKSAPFNGGGAMWERLQPRPPPASRKLCNGEKGVRFQRIFSDAGPRC